MKDRLAADELQCVGTSATLADAGTREERQAAIAEMASQIERSAPEKLVLGLL